MDWQGDMGEDGEDNPEALEPTGKAQKRKSRQEHLVIKGIGLASGETCET